MLFLIGGSSWLGAAIGIWVGVRCIGSQRPLRILFGLAGVAAVAVPGVGVPQVASAAIVGAAVGVGGVGWWWNAIPFERRRVASSFAPRVVSEITWHELMGSIYLVLVATSLLAVALGVSLGSWVGAVAAAVVLLAAGWWLRDRSDDAPAPGALADDGRLIEARNARERREIVDRMFGDSAPTSVLWPPTVFRGLVGWNLGLGLDSEAAAWAAQLADRHGFGGLLSDPEDVLGEDDVAALVTCRAMAGGGERIVVELGEGATQSVVRRMAKIVAEERSDRPLVVVTDDPPAGRAFLARSH